MRTCRNQSLVPEVQPGEPAQIPTCIDPGASPENATEVGAAPVGDKVSSRTQQFDWVGRSEHPKAEFAPIRCENSIRGSGYGKLTLFLSGV